MQTQQRYLKKNYIGIVSDKVAEQSAADSPANSSRSVRSYFLALVAAIRKQRNGAGS